MSFLDRAAIVAVNDLKREEVAVPEWGGTVIVRELTAKERDLFFEWVRKNGEAAFSEFRVRAVRLSLVDEQGAQLFAEADEPELAKKSTAVIDRLFETASRLSGLQEKDVKQIGKNSKATPQNGSSSD